MSRESNLCCFRYFPSERQNEVFACWKSPFITVVLAVVDLIMWRKKYAKRAFDIMCFALPSSANEKGMEIFSNSYFALSATRKKRKFRVRLFVVDEQERNWNTVIFAATPPMRNFTLDFQYVSRCQYGKWNYRFDKCHAMESFLPTEWMQCVPNPILVTIEVREGGKIRCKAISVFIPTCLASVSLSRMCSFNFITMIFDFPSQKIRRNIEKKDSIAYLYCTLSTS